MRVSSCSLHEIDASLFVRNSPFILLTPVRGSSEQLGTYKEYVRTFPEIDTPEIFGLHPNADLTFRVKEVNALFSTLGNTQPKARHGMAQYPSHCHGVTRASIPPSSGVAFAAW